MKVLSVASEVVPLVKTGGLADVAGALPPALAAHGVDVTTLVPGYRQVMRHLAETSLSVAAEFDLLGVPARLLSGQSDGLDIIVLDAPAYYDRPGSSPYTNGDGQDFDDNWRRFAAFAKAAALVAEGAVAGYRPDVVHAHDWQAALAPAYLRYGGGVPSVLTVHNLAFQGQFPADIFGELELPGEAWGIDGVEYYGGVGFLKAGLLMADAITTVSPTYAREIRTPAFGMGLDGLLNGRAHRLSGIINGIDTAAWDPGTDALIARNYDVHTLDGRAANRRAVEERFGLDHDDTPLIGFVTRLTWQKGMDVFAGAVDALIASGCKFAVLGAGEALIQNLLTAAAGRHKGRFGIITGYDEGASHLIQAGADAMMVPSRFEPCGLTQLIALRYGCIPVVTRTGGLADTVIDANMAAVTAGVGTGVMIDELSVEGLIEAVRRLAELKGEPETWARMQTNGMSTDVSWETSAGRYAELYRSIAG